MLIYIYVASSECISFFSWEPFTVGTLVISNDTYHLIELWSNLDAASESTLLVVHSWSSFEGGDLCAWFLIKLFEIWITNKNLALTTADTWTIVVIRNLMGSKSMFDITSFAVWVQTWSSVSIKYFQKTLTWLSGISSWDTIWWEHIDPYTKTNIAY